MGLKKFRNRGNGAESKQSRRKSETIQLDESGDNSEEITRLQ